MQRSKSFSTAVFAAAAGIALIGSVLLYASYAFAGVGVSVTPNFPSPVVVGTNDIAVTMGITNNSDGGDGNPLTLTSIKLIPSCGAISSGNCTSLDPGVFNVDAAGTGAGACAANTFTIAETNPASGEVTFTPNVAIALTPGQTCTINFTVDVLAVPDVDATGAAGVQTLQLGSVDGIDQLQQPGSGTGSDTTTVNKASPGIQTTPSAGGPVGTVLNDTATLSGGLNPTGNVTFKLFAPSDATCAGAAVYTDVDGSSPYATSPGYTSLVAGTYRWTADYAGDANNNPVSSGCQDEQVVITKASPGIQTTPSAGGPVGTVLNDTATLSGGASPTGSVTFKLYAPSDATCSGVPAYTDTDPSAPYATSPGFASNAAGTWRWTADYAGDANNNAVSSGCQDEQVTVTALPGRIIVVKQTTPDATTTPFEFDSSYGLNFFLQDGQQNDSGDLVAGTYSVAEVNIPTNWSMTGATCSDGSPVNNISLQAGETVTCTFNNTFTPPAVQGCSPGYWKQSQHFGSYPSGVFPNSLFTSVGFENAFPGKTLLQVLQQGGGGLNALGRIIVGAYLNASTVSGFPYTSAQVVADFNAVFPGTNAAYNTLKAKYEALQDPCPFGRNPGPAGPVI